MKDELTYLDKLEAPVKDKADEDESRWDERLKKLTRQKLPPVQQQPEEEG